MPEDYNDTGDDYKVLIWYGLYVALMLAIGFAGLTIGKGLSEVTLITRYVVYSLLLLGGFLFFAMVKVARIRGYLPGMITMLHDPELSILGKVSFIKNPVYLFIISTIFTSFLGLMAALNSQISVLLFPFSTGIAIQQTTPFAGTLFSIFAASSENVTIYIIITLILSLLVYLAKQIDLPPIYGYYATLVIGTIVSATFFSRIHVLVSGSDEIIQTSHYIFGALIAIFYMTTGSVLPGDLLHFTNNLLFSVKQFFSSDAILTTFSIIVGIAILIFIMTLVFKQSTERNYG